MSKNSILEIYDMETGERRAVREFDRIIEAPNWLLDGDTILYNAQGRIWRYSLSRNREELVDTGGCVCCNNDHVPSPDNRFLAVSCSPDPADGLSSQIYILPLTGGEPRQVTVNAPSFLHGWSVGGELAYCAFRPGPSDGQNRIDIYAIPESGGPEVRLTDGQGYNDGPEYSPDGRHIWFNSTRSGLMQIWRMDRDGRNLTRMTHTDSNCWFPHLSPDGKTVVYLVFRKGDLEPWEHLPDKQVELWAMGAGGEDPRKLLDLFGGQGTINVNSWSPDGKRFAFVSYW